MAIELKLFFGAIILFFLLTAVLYMVNKENFQSKKICFRERCFFLEIANTPVKRAEGLMFRKELPKDKGMLFVFPKEDVYNFWMKNTLIPLDIIWLDRNKKVVFIKKEARPCQKTECPFINPGQKAKYVLELNAGQAEEMGLKTGHKFLFEF